MQANVRGRMERMLVRDKNLGAQTTPDFSKQLSDNKTKNNPSVGKGYSYSFLLCLSSFVVFLSFCLSFFFIFLFLFVSFFCFSLPFSCLFHSFSSLPFPSNLQKAAKGKETMKKTSSVTRGGQTRENNRGKTKNENKCKSPPQKQKRC